MREINRLLHDGVIGLLFLWLMGIATAMFFYLVHRLAFEFPATYFGLRGLDGLGATYGAAAVMLTVLYPMCRWYRTVKAAHPRSFLRYL